MAAPQGAEFGRLVAGSLLAKFIDTFKIYSREGLSPTPKFQTFQTKIRYCAMQERSRDLECIRERW